MNKESISQRQAVSMIALFTVGSSLVFGISKNSMQDAWIAGLLALAAMMPVVYIYARVLSRYPGKDLFEICLGVFGGVLGRVVIVLYVWYAFHLGALVLRNFSQFIQITAFNMMPQTISMIAILLCIWVVKRGVETLGRWSTVVLPVLAIAVVFTVLLLIKDMHLSNLMPVGEHLNEVPKDALLDFTFPVAETVLFLGVLGAVNKDGSPGKAWLWGLLISVSLLIFGGLMRNILVLGFPTETDLLFPSYGAVSIIIAGSVISRIENIVGANFLLAGFVKASVCLLVASKGTARLFAAEDYRPFVAPLGLLMMALASILYQNVFQMLDFFNVYIVYALPFEVLIPIVLCIAAEIRYLVKNRGRKEPEPAGPS